MNSFFKNKIFLIVALMKIICKFSCFLVKNGGFQNLILQYYIGNNRYFGNFYNGDPSLQGWYSKIGDSLQFVTVQTSQNSHTQILDLISPYAICQNINFKQNKIYNLKLSYLSHATFNTFQIILENKNIAILQSSSKSNFTVNNFTVNYFNYVFTANQINSVLCFESLSTSSYNIGTYIDNITILQVITLNPEIQVLIPIDENQIIVSFEMSQNFSEIEMFLNNEIFASNLLSLEFENSNFKYKYRIQEKQVLKPFQLKFQSVEKVQNDEQIYNFTTVPFIMQKEGYLQTVDEIFSELNDVFNSSTFKASNQLIFWMNDLGYSVIWIGFINVWKIETLYYFILFDKLPQNLKKILYIILENIHGQSILSKLKINPPLLSLREKKNEKYNVLKSSSKLLKNWWKTLITCILMTIILNLSYFINQTYSQSKIIRTLTNFSKQRYSIISYFMLGSLAHLTLGSAFLFQNPQYTDLSERINNIGNFFCLGLVLAFPFLHISFIKNKRIYEKCYSANYKFKFAKVFTLMSYIHLIYTPFLMIIGNQIVFLTVVMFFPILKCFFFFKMNLKGKKSSTFLFLLTSFLHLLYSSLYLVLLVNKTVNLKEVIALTIIVNLVVIALIKLFVSLYSIFSNTIRLLKFVFTCLQNNLSNANHKQSNQKTNQQIIKLSKIVSKNQVESSNLFMKIRKKNRQLIKVSQIAPNNQKQAQSNLLKEIQKKKIRIYPKKGFKNIELALHKTNIDSF